MCLKQVEIISLFQKGSYDGCLEKILCQIGSFFLQYRLCDGPAVTEGIPLLSFVLKKQRHQADNIFIKYHH